MKVVTTRGAGFIGSHLARELLARNFNVTCVDNLTAGKRDNVPYGAKFIYGDIRNNHILEKAFTGADFVFHLAALPSVPYSIDYPEETHGVNVNRTLSALEAARSVSIKKIIFASSYSIYGDQQKKA